MAKNTPFIDWNELEAVLTEDETRRIAPAKAFLEQPLSLDGVPNGERADKIKQYLDGLREQRKPIEDGFSKLADILNEGSWDPAPDFREAVSLALIARLDRLRGAVPERALCRFEDEGGAQVEALSADAEGSLLLNAFVPLHLQLVKYFVNQEVQGDRQFKHRPYRFGDLVHIGIYGGFRKVARWEEGVEEVQEEEDGPVDDLRSNGLLSAAVKFHPGHVSDARFGTYAGEAIRMSLYNYCRRERDAMLRWPGDSARIFHEDGSLMEKNYFADPKADPVAECARAEMDERMEGLMRTLTPREREVLQMRIKAEMTLEEVARAYGITRERIRQIEFRGLLKLRQPLRRARVLDYEDGAPEPDVPDLPAPVSAEAASRANRRYRALCGEQPVQQDAASLQFVIRLDAGYAPRPYEHPASLRLLEYLRAIEGMEDQAEFMDRAGGSPIKVEMRLSHNHAPGLFAYIHCDNAETFQHIRSFVRDFPVRLQASSGMAM